MAGSQLKQLKEALKAKGLVGQTNVKRKNKKIAPSETRRDQQQRQREMGVLRDEFNQFDSRINRTKHDYTVIAGGKFVTAGLRQHNAAAKSRLNVEKALKTDYDADKKTRHRVGGLVDKRFGELNRNLTEEEKMLQRYTRERQSSLRKSNVFLLESDDDMDDDTGGFALTHSGRALDFDESLAELPKRYVDEDEVQNEKPRKKSKKEVMAEVIAKSKFHKKQRQMAFEKTQEDIMDLDDDFALVMGEMRGQKAAAKAPKSAQDLEYDAKVRELTYDRRAVPAERTKTDEELAQEHAEKMKRLEDDRMKRMQGLEESGGADDLDDFWAGDEDEEAQENGEEEEASDQDESEESEEESGGRPKRVKQIALAMPASYEDFAGQVRGQSGKAIVAHVQKLGELYHPRLAQGNKQKCDELVGHVFKHILTVAQEPFSDGETVDLLTKLVRTLAERHNEALVETVRAELGEIEERFADEMVLRKSDTVFFVALGYIFSTSDHYHLAVTPALILMNQFLAGVVGAAIDTEILPQLLAQGLFICDVLLSYQKFAKRFDPEVANYVGFCVRSLLPGAGLKGLQISKSFVPHEVSEPISVQALFEPAKNPDEFKYCVLIHALATMDKCMATWREKSASVELAAFFAAVLELASSSFGSEVPKAGEMAQRFAKLASNTAASRRPLTLQEHKKMAIKTFAPKFEENFNPDKKSYDVNRERQELSKMKAQIKKEKKLAMKDIRKQTRFVGRQQIGEKKAMYAEYHKKMANIVNSISTVEGAEKNQYERDKKKRQNQR